MLAQAEESEGEATDVRHTSLCVRRTKPDCDGLRQACYSRSIRLLSTVIRARLAKVLAGFKLKFPSLQRCDPSSSMCDHRPCDLTFQEQSERVALALGTRTTRSAWRRKRYATQVGAAYASQRSECNDPRDG